MIQHPFLVNSVLTSAFLEHVFHFSSSVSQDTFKDETLRDDLRFYFMNPCEKYRARKHIPWKLGVQVLKIIMVTTQVRTREEVDRTTVGCVLWSLGRQKPACLL